MRLFSMICTFLGYLWLFLISNILNKKIQAEASFLCWLEKSVNMSSVTVQISFDYSSCVKNSMASNYSMIIDRNCIKTLKKIIWLKTLIRVFYFAFFTMVINRIIYDFLPWFLLSAIRILSTRLLYIPAITTDFLGRALDKSSLNSSIELHTFIFSFSIWAISLSFQFIY